MFMFIVIVVMDGIGITVVMAATVQEKNARDIASINRCSAHLAPRPM
jgi:hypothetical protein